jgi:predicted transcriptional regulator
MAATMSDVLGRPVRFQQTDIAGLRDALINQGASLGMADATVALVKAEGEGVDDLVKGPTPLQTPTTSSGGARRSFARGSHIEGVAQLPVS